MMHISLITAMTKQGIIGQDNQLPWHIPEDLKLFKKITLGKPIIMGRRTFDSIGKPLPGRHNIILTQNKQFLAEGCTVVHSIEDTLEVVKDSEEAMVIGGACLYQQFLPLATHLYISLIHKDYHGDTVFPSIDWEQWIVKEEEKYREFTHQFLERK